MSLALLMFSCRAPAEPVSAPVPVAAPSEATSPAAAPAFAPSASQSEMIRRLSARDQGPTCAEVEALSTAPVADLREIVAKVSLPPAVPMRAAECLIVGHAAEAEADITAWMSGPDTKGLALLVAGQLPSVDRTVGKRFAAAGLAGPHAESVRKRLEASPDAEVQAWAALP